MEKIIEENSTYTACDLCGKGFDDFVNKNTEEREDAEDAMVFLPGTDYVVHQKCMERVAVEKCATISH
jgi:hypothetical protein